MKIIVVIAAALVSLSVLAEDKTICGYYGHDEQNFTGPERSWLDVRGRGKISLIFWGTTPFYSEGIMYCCFGDFNSSRKELRVKTGCVER
jgi:hypothetical protein